MWRAVRSSSSFERMNARTSSSDIAAPAEPRFRGTVVASLAMSDSCPMSSDLSTSTAENVRGASGGRLVALGLTARDRHDYRSAGVTLRRTKSVAVTR